MWKRKPQPHSDSVADLAPEQAYNSPDIVLEYPGEDPGELSPLPWNIHDWAVMEMGIWVYSSNYKPGEGGLLRVQWRNNQIKDYCGNDRELFEALRGDYNEFNMSGKWRR